MALGLMTKIPGTLAVVVALASLSACELDTFDSPYASVSDAAKDGMVVKRWIPPWVPLSGTDVREVHNFDSNASALSVDLPGAEELKLPVECETVKYEDVVPNYFDRHWWPSELELENEYSFFQCPADAADFVFVAIAVNGKRVLHWRTYMRPN